MVVTSGFPELYLSSRNKLLLLASSRHPIGCPWGSNLHHLVFAGPMHKSEHGFIRVNNNYNHSISVTP